MLDALQEQVNEFALVVGLPVSLTTPGLDSIVFSPHSGRMIDGVRAESLLSRDTEEWVVRWFREAGVGRSLDPVFVPGMPEKQAMSRWVVPVHSGTRILAYLCILDPEGRCTAPTLTGLAERVTEIADIILGAEDSLRVAGNLLRRTLTGDAQGRASAATELFGQLDHADAWRIAVGTSFAAGAVHSVEQARPKTLPSSSSHFPTRGPVAVEARLEDHHVFLLAARHRIDLDMLAALAPCCPRPFIGIGGAVDDPLQLDRSYQQALGSLRTASIQRAPERITDWTDLGPIKVLSLQAPWILADTVHDKIAALDPGETDLLETVDHYLRHGRKPDLVADSLHIHRGTLYYRLRKFQDATGLDLESGTDRLTVQLSFEALKLLRAPAWQHLSS